MNGDPIKRLEVDSSHLILRIVLVALACVLAITSFGYAIRSLLNRNSGWQEVEAYVDGVDCSSDFELKYCFDSTEVSPTAEYKAVSALYTLALEEAYQAFYPEGSMKVINAQPNVTVKVDPVLYRALEMVQVSENRCLYLGPVYVEYDRIFLCEDELGPHTMIRVRMTRLAHMWRKSPHTPMILSTSICNYWVMVRFV